MQEQSSLSEEWRPIPGWEDWYSVSSLGRIRNNRILRGAPDPNGYPTVCLTRPGKSLSKRVHSLVAAVFLGPRPRGLQVNHKDGIKTHNAHANLEYVTHQENMRHAAEMGLWNPCLAGEENPRAKLNWVQVEQIRSSHRSQSKLAAIYGVSKTAIRFVRQHKTWRV